MSEWVFPPHARASVAVDGTNARFPVRRIFCVGRNYAEHGLEMGGDPKTEPPFFFTKPADAVVESGAEIPFPPAAHDLHYEGELVVAIGRAGSDVSGEDAPGLIFGHAAGNDLTRRDLQAEAKARSRPWDMSKAFDRSAVVGAIRPGNRLDPAAELALTVNGEIRQSSRISQMIWPVNGIIAILSRLVTLAPGDLIMTGTPAGVGALAPGDTCEVTITDLAPARVTLS